jgi:hypothetical protein
MDILEGILGDSYGRNFERVFEWKDQWCMDATSRSITIC